MEPTYPQRNVLANAKEACTILPLKSEALKVLYIMTTKSFHQTNFVVYKPILCGWEIKARMRTLPH